MHQTHHRKYIIATNHHHQQRTTVREGPRARGALGAALQTDRGVGPRADCAARRVQVRLACVYVYVCVGCVCSAAGTKPSLSKPALTAAQNSNAPSPPPINPPSTPPSTPIPPIGSFFGIYGTELSKTFAAEALARIPANRDVVLICENGGSLETKPGVAFGFQSRSLKAAYFLRQAGMTNKISVVKGGVAQWVSDGLPLEAGADDYGDWPAAAEEEEETAGAARGPGALLAGLFAGLRR